MALMTRLARLVRADLNAILDRLEAPELVLAQSVREMEQALDQERRTLAGMDRELERLARRDQALAEEETRTMDALAEGLAEGREALARPLIRRRLESGRRRTAIQRQRVERTAERDRLAQRLAAHASRLDDLRARADRWLADTGPTGDERSPNWELDPVQSDADTGISDAEVELELLRLRRREVTP
ncbi:PspA/IM30 family protein [uncultured Lamprocystis sp.]|jgi:phage shock protein A|uniref:PspA/IM30 family protein n=1 Tax=uncultured Lamprocystis sp. TaxID=543132 RepID=UPI0025D5198D|nr:PspA/IM30 family protein [uncultured Lamprocystis sp.]